ncbi:MAG: M16 family metallopeptidase [Candidatus Binatia bacterium]
MKKFILACFVLFLGIGIPSLPQARLQPQRSVLENGLVLLTSEQRAIPMVTFNLLIKAGSRYDPQGQEGLASLTAILLTYGTSKRTALQISETLDFIGASLATGCGRNLANVSLTLLKKDLDTGLQLLAEILTESLFAPEEIDRQKQSVIASIKAKKEDPGEIAYEKFSAALFPRSPYGRPIEGTEGSVRNIDRKSLVSFYQRLYRPNRSILAVVGDISHEEMVQKLTSAFRSWKKRASVQELPRSPSPGPADFITINKNLTQANIVLGHEGVPRGHPDYYAIRVMNYILGGGGLSSRLADSIRNERGLAYSVYSYFSSGKYVGRFQVSMQTKNETAQEAIRIATEEIRRIREQGVTETELKEAKDYLIGSFPLRLDTNRRVARFLARVEFLELGLDYLDRYPELIRRVNRQDIIRVARAHLQPEKLIVVVVANLEKAGFGN